MNEGFAPGPYPHSGPGGAHQRMTWACSHHHAINSVLITCIKMYSPDIDTGPTCPVCHHQPYYCTSDHGTSLFHSHTPHKVTTYRDHFLTCSASELVTVRSGKSYQPAFLPTNSWLVFPTTISRSQHNITPWSQDHITRELNEAASCILRNAFTT